MADRLLRIADDLEAAIAGGDRRGLVGIQGGHDVLLEIPFEVTPRRTG